MILDNIRRTIANLIDPTNRFNRAFLGMTGGGFTAYDYKNKSYVEKGYNINPIVFSMINQMASKTASVPFYIKKIEDEHQKRKLDQLRQSTKGDMSMMQFIKYMKLQTKAFSKDDMPFPMERPNPNQTWTELWALYKVFLKSTGNVYLYIPSPEDGLNKGEPNLMYLLPSHLMTIVVKEGSDLLSVDSPIKEYMLIEGNQQVTFPAEDVIHIKRPNPNYDERGGHLYGMSELSAALRNIQSSNEGINNNIKTMTNGGAFGLIHSKNQALTEPQAKEIKDRLREMDNSTDRLANIAGVSAEVGFTRLSLSSNELKPFDHLNWDEKQIANCLNWEIMDGGRGDFGGTIKELRKQRVVDNIQPDLKLLEDALNNHFLPRFKRYKGTEVVFDVMELPEMQNDMKELTEWLTAWQDRGTLHRDEIRPLIGFEALETEEMQTHTVNADILSLDEAINNSFSITNER